MQLELEKDIKESEKEHPDYKFFNFSRRGQRLSNGVVARRVQLFPVSVLCSPFGFFFSQLSFFHQILSVPDLAPNHNLEKFQMDFVSKANTPPPGTRLGSGPGLGSGTEWELVATLSVFTRLQWQPERWKKTLNQGSGPPSALDEFFYPLPNGQEVGVWQQAVNCQLGSIFPFSAPVCFMGSPL